ncbi:MAG: DUF1456 family protein [Bdellovibrionota bacterium]
MLNNDVLRSVRYMLNIPESKMIEIIKLGGGSATPQEMSAYLKTEDEPGFIECPQNAMDRFLNGLIYFRRGKDDSRPPLSPVLPTNNIVLKKLRVAFALKDDDVKAILQSVGFEISKTELSALFRSADHVNYRECGDQILRNFLKGLTIRVERGG